MSKRIKHNPYSDGSREDDEYYAQKAKARRSELSGAQAIDKILSYLDQQANVIDSDIKRHRTAKDEINWQACVERLAWVEGMIFWVNHNV